MELTYTQHGDYLFPDLIPDEPEKVDLGKYGLMRQIFLQKNHPGIYQSMILLGTLQAHLLEIDRTATERVEQIMEQMLQKDPAPDKETRQLEWVQHMNSTKMAAEEIVLSELIYA